jgi:hypothetical protein
MKDYKELLYKSTKGVQELLPKIPNSTGKWGARGHKMT